MVSTSNGVNHQAIVAMTSKLVNREGLGDILLMEVKIRLPKE